MNIIKRKFALAIAIIMVMITVLAACTSEKASAKLPDGAIAVVNNTVISIDEFNKMVALQKLSYEAQLGPGILNEVVDGVTLLDLLKQNVLDQMIMDELVIQQAVKKNVEITEEEVENSYKTFLSMLGEDEDFLQVLQENGLDEDFIKNVIIRKSLITEFYANEYFYSIEVSEEDAREHYESNIELYKNEQVRARHILISDEELAKELLERLKNGEDFAALAKQYGEDGTKEVGGDLDYFSRGRMVPEFEEPVFKLEVGQLSDIIQSRFGYHLVLLEDRIVDEIPFEEEKQYIMDELRSIAFEKHLQELQENSKIIKSEKL